MYKIAGDILTLWEAQYERSTSGDLVKLIVTQTVSDMDHMQDLLKEMFIRARTCQYPRYQFNWTDTGALQNGELVKLLTVITCEASPASTYWTLCNEVLNYEFVDI